MGGEGGGSYQTGRFPLLRQGTFSSAGSLGSPKPSWKGAEVREAKGWKGEGGWEGWVGSSGFLRRANVRCWRLEL